jgi:hypothetical protein
VLTITPCLPRSIDFRIDLFAREPVQPSPLCALPVWAVTVRANWRVIFRFAGGDALDVDYIDYH